MKRERSPQYKADKNDRYSLRKRAEAVGLELLPQGRPKDHVKRAWLEKIYKLEAQDREKRANFEKLLSEPL